MTVPIGSVVVPAHDKALTIASRVGHCRARASAGVLETGLVSHGSTDEMGPTDRAAGVGSSTARVVDLPNASQATGPPTGDETIVRGMASVRSPRVRAALPCTAGTVIGTSVFAAHQAAGRRLGLFPTLRGMTGTQASDVTASKSSSRPGPT